MYSTYFLMKQNATRLPVGKLNIGDASHNFLWRIIQNKNQTDSTTKYQHAQQNQTKMEMLVTVSVKRMFYAWVLQSSCSFADWITLI